MDRQGNIGRVQRGPQRKFTAIFMTTAKQCCLISDIWGVYRQKLFPPLANSAVSKLRSLGGLFALKQFLLQKYFWRYKIQIPDYLSITHLQYQKYHCLFILFLPFYHKNRNIYLFLLLTMIFSNVEGFCCLFLNIMELKASFQCNMYANQKIQIHINKQCIQMAIF